MPLRVTILLAVTTDPTDKVAASPHSGGWSESFHMNSSLFVDRSIFTKWASARANILAGECSIIGFRQQLVTISGNKLLPGGSGAGTLNVPGAYATDMNAPQDALMLNFGLTGQPTQVRIRLAGLPDSQVARGEYQPQSSMKAQVTNYINQVIGSGFGSIVRDLTVPDARVKGYVGGVLTTLTATGALAGQYIRLRRVRDDNGRPVEGAFLVTAVVANADGTTSYTLFGGPGSTVTRPNGTARHDLLAFATLLNGTPNRLVVRKVGRPFVQYRGRRSKR